MVPVFQKALELKIDPEVAHKVLKRLSPKALKMGGAGQNLIVENNNKSLMSRINPDAWKNSENKHVRDLWSLMVEKKHYRNPELSFEIITGEMQVTRHFLSELLNDVLGINFYAMLRFFRIQEAKHLLISNPKTKILEIALESGFDNKSSFNNVFKEITGLSPREYRKRELSMRND